MKRSFKLIVKSIIIFGLFILISISLLNYFYYKQVQVYEWDSIE